MNLTETSIEQRIPLHAKRERRFVEFIRQIDPAWWQYILLVSDILLIVVAFTLAYYVRYQLQWFWSVDPASLVSLQVYIPIATALVVLLLLSFWLSDVYPHRRSRSLFSEIYTIGTATTAGVVILITISLFFQQILYSRLIFLYTALFVTLFLGISRFTIHWLCRYLYQFGVCVERILLVGAGDIGRMVMRNIVARPELGYRLIGFLDDNPHKGQTDIGRFKALGPIKNFETVLHQTKINRVIISLPWESHPQVQSLLQICDQLGLRAQVIPDLFHITRNQMEVEQLNGIPLISTRELSIQGWNLALKRIFDTIIILAALPILLPIFLLIGLAIRLDSPGPIFYSQIRVGKDGNRFRCFKFRSMVQRAEELRQQVADQNEASGPLFKVRNDPRITRVGRFIRRYSLDELPQLYNVLLGEMSLIGPRPNLPQEVEQYEDWHQKRLSASPGMTGLWQVSGRSDLTFDEMVLLDIYYVENWNLMMDLGILLRSIPAVLQGRGAY